MSIIPAPRANQARPKCNQSARLSGLVVGFRSPRVARIIHHRRGRKFAPLSRVRPSCVDLADLIMCDGTCSERSSCSQQVEQLARWRRQLHRLAARPRVAMLEPRAGRAAGPINAGTLRRRETEASGGLIARSQSSAAAGAEAATEGQRLKSKNNSGLSAAAAAAEQFGETSASECWSDEWSFALLCLPARRRQPASQPRQRRRRRGPK